VGKVKVNGGGWGEVLRGRVQDTFSPNPSFF